MRISELAQKSGLPLATVKYYLRQGLVHPGRPTGATQAQYDETHVSRLRLARALLQVGGLSLAAARDVLEAVDRSSQSLPEVLAVTHSALPPSVPVRNDTPRAKHLMRELGWRVRPTASALGQLEHALETLDTVGMPADAEALATYARSARQIAEMDVASVPDGSPEEVAAAVIIGTVLWEPVLLALRRLAQAAVSAEVLVSDPSRGADMESGPDLAAERTQEQAQEP